MKYKISTPKSIFELGKRANQEDAIYPQMGSATEDSRLFIVCDGMGGHEFGEVASSSVCRSISSYIETNIDGDKFNEEHFFAALSAAYDDLDRQDTGAKKKMGTTLTFMMLYDKGCMVSHIGDSRIYHIRPSKCGEHEILYKSSDHSLVNKLYEIGEITFEQMKTDSRKNVITRVMQPNQENRAKADIRIITDIQAGDYFYLCSDGMLEISEDWEIANILRMDCDDNQKIRIFTDVTADNSDNHSAYLIHIDAVYDDDGNQINEPDKDDSCVDDEPLHIEENEQIEIVFQEENSDIENSEDIIGSSELKEEQEEQVEDKQAEQKQENISMNKEVEDFENNADCESDDEFENEQQGKNMPKTCYSPPQMSSNIFKFSVLLLLAIIIIILIFR